MKKIIALFVLCIYCLACIPATVNATDTQQALSSNSRQGLDAQISVLGDGKLISNAKAVFLYETTTNTLVYSYNADEKLSPASLVKVLTALIAVEEGDLSAKITVKQSVLDTVPNGAVKTEFIDGEVLTLQDLLYCMMVDSGNDAAALIADHIAGDQSAFVAKMNAYAIELGCTNTSLTNVHGLHDDDQYMSARDAGRIMVAASNNETIRQIMGAKDYTVNANQKSTERNLVSEYHLINGDTKKTYLDERVKAGRAGIADDKTRNVAAIAESDGMQFVSVVMGSVSKYESNRVTITVYGGYAETSKLLDLATDGYSSYQLVYESQILQQIAVPNGDCDASLGASKSEFAILPDGTDMSSLSIEYVYDRQLIAPVTAGEQYAVARYMYGDICVAEVGLVAMNPVQENITTMVEQKTTPKQENTSVWTTVLMIVVCLLVLYFAYITYVRKMRAKTKARNSQRNRRSQYDRVGKS